MLTGLGCRRLVPVGPVRCTSVPPEAARCARPRGDQWRMALRLGGSGPRQRLECCACEGTRTRGTSRSRGAPGRLPQNRRRPPRRFCSPSSVSGRSCRTGLGAAAAGAARNATLELSRGLMNDQVIDDTEFAPALTRAAMDYIEARLLAGPGLSPRRIAAALNVSVRTLHRAFGQGVTSSVMGYVRERRLERARAELISKRLTVSEIAARRHFADSSHFSMAYKRRFAESPRASRQASEGVESRS